MKFTGEWTDAPGGGDHFALDATFEKGELEQLRARLGALFGPPFRPAGVRAKRTPDKDPRAQRDG